MGERNSSRSPAYFKGIRQFEMAISKAASTAAAD